MTGARLRDASVAFLLVFAVVPAFAAVAVLMHFEERAIRAEIEARP